MSLPFDLSLWVAAFWSGCSTVWSASDTDFKNLSSNFQEGELSPPLISKWQWLQKPKFGHLHLLIRMSPPLGASAFWSGSLHLWVCLLFDQGVSTLWSASDTDFKNLNLGVSTFWSASNTDFKNLSLGVYTFDQGVSTFGCLSFLTRVSPPFDQGVQKLFQLSLISKWHWLQKPKFQLSGGGVVSTIWSASDTLTAKT